MPIGVRNQKIYTCTCCRLIDEKVECTGIYYCPNPFCRMSGAANWKRDNLDVEETSDGLALKSYNGWLDKGMLAIDKMGYFLGNKIMSLEYTKKTIKEIKDSYDHTR